MQHIWRVLSLIPQYRSRVARVIIINAGLSILALAFPYLFKLIVDAIVAASTNNISIEKTTNLLAFLLLGITLLRLAVIALTYFQERQADTMWVAIGSTLRKQMYRQLETLSIDFFERNKVGEIMQRASGIVEVARWVFGLTEGILGSIMQNVLIIAFLLYKAPVIGLILIIIGPINIWNAVQKTIQTKPIRRVWLKQMEQALGKMNESISHATSVRSLSAEPAIRKEFDRKVDNWRDGRTKEFGVQWRSNIVRGFINTVGLVLPVAYVSYGAIGGRFTAGDVFLILTLTQTFLNGLRPIARLISDTGDVDTAAERIMMLLDEQPTIVDQPDAIELADITTIEFCNVSFTYPGTSRQILENISFKIESNKSLALVGPSGSGKSTITKLILRFYEPSSGQILINGQPIERFTQKSVRRQLGVVMQDVALFNDTVAENLRLAKPDATLNELNDAAKLSHADVFIAKLPDKYQTLVGERGIKLSGGEKQRVAIARAILRNPKLVVLDEATSALDSESERFVQDGLKQLMQGKMAIIIAHRLSTIVQADQIIVLQDGKVAETGDHAKLANKKSGLYARLYKLQTTGAIS